MNVKRLFCLGLVYALTCLNSVQAETLRTASVGNIVPLLNPFASMVQGVINPHSMLHDMLLYVATDGTLEPGLAVSWEATGPTTWIIKLRPDVSYANGRPVTADAIAKNIAYLKSEQAQRYVISAEVRTIKSARAVDDLTLEVETIVPDVLLPKRFGTIPMPEPYLYEELGPHAFSQAPVGTGSYVLEDWRLVSQRPIMVANPNSWRPPVTFDRIEMRVVKDAATQVQALLTGAIDLGSNFGVIEIEQLEAMGFRIEVRPGGQIQALAFSNRDPDSPFADVRVRQAMNYAVNKQEIADIIMMGTTQPVSQPGIATMAGHNPNVAPYPYDPDKAKALLAEAGYADGLSFRAEVLIGGVVEGTTMYLKIAQDLAKIGVHMEVQPLQGPQWIRKYFSGEWDKADAISATWNGASYWDVIRAIEIFSCKKPGAFFCEPDMMPLIDATHGMFDEEERERTLQSLSKTMHDLAPTIFLHQLVDIVAVNDRLGPLPFRHKQLAVDQLRLAP